KNDDFYKTARTKLDTDKEWVTPAIFGTENRYVIHALVGDMNHFATRAYYTFADKRTVMSVIEGPVVDEEKEWRLSFYYGPKEERALSAVDPRLEKALDYAGMLAPISRFLLMILNWLYLFFHNYGFAIIILTMLLQLCLLPLTMKSDKAMKHNAELQKKIAYLKNKYKDNPEQFEREKMELLKKMQGLSSFLPLVIQAMVFFALSRVLGNAIELYQSSLLWIPDLSATDPYYILPLCVMGGMLLRSKAEDATQRISMGIVALVFGALMTTLSSGLVLYIACSSLYSGLQLRLMQYLKIV
ncbi:MAG TPA: YidC/Oxa1 family insertase periplasmic-domain containing protein, partial [Candidatus Bathyarchaeia archaeon]|nr:YidC/Oxa1 family insertase periplasmic-domain containing protein [Candidatus Bathyarchaeia archaeon]